MLHCCEPLIYDILFLMQESLSRHEQLNAYEALKGGAAVYGVNVFSDLTQEEFKSKPVLFIHRE